MTLAVLGFRSVKAFQEAWNLGAKLVPDGVDGVLTQAAMRVSMQRHIAGLGDISAHYSADEFRCHCGGKLKGCQLTLVKRELLQSLETARKTFGAIGVVSGYRCPLHNAAVDGADGSQHLYGTAADVSIRDGLASVRRLDLFSGIGSKVVAPHRVTHVDRRDVGGHNTTHGTVNRPTLWTYPGA